MLEKTRLPDTQHQLARSVCSVRRAVVNGNRTQASTDVHGKGEQQVSVNKPLPLAENKNDAEPRCDHKLHSVFQAVDRTNSGYINIMDLRRVVERLDDTISNEELSKIMQQAAVEQNGQLSFNEFAEIMRLRHGQLQATGSISQNDNASQGSSCSEGFPSIDPEQVVKNMMVMRKRLEESKQRSHVQETSSTTPSPSKTPGPLGRVSLEGILERSALLARQRAQAKAAGDFVAAVERITDVADKLNNEK